MVANRQVACVPPCTEADERRLDEADSFCPVALLGSHEGVIDAPMIWRCFHGRQDGRGRKNA